MLLGEPTPTAILPSAEVKCNPVTGECILKQTSLFRAKEKRTYSFDMMDYKMLNILVSSLDKVEHLPLLGVSASENSNDKKTFTYKTTQNAISTTATEVSFNFRMDHTGNMGLVRFEVEITAPTQMNIKLEITSMTKSNSSMSQMVILSPGSELIFNFESDYVKSVDFTAKSIENKPFNFTEDSQTRVDKTVRAYRGNWVPSVKQSISLKLTSTQNAVSSIITSLGSGTNTNTSNTSNIVQIIVNIETQPSIGVGGDLNTILSSFGGTGKFITQNPPPNTTQNPPPTPPTPPTPPNTTQNPPPPQDPNPNAFPPPSQLAEATTSVSASRGQETSKTRLILVGLFIVCALGGWYYYRQSQTPPQPQVIILPPGYSYSQPGPGVLPPPGLPKP